MIFGEDVGRSAYFAEIGSEVERLNNAPSNYPDFVCIGKDISILDVAGRNYRIDLYVSPNGQIAVCLSLRLSGEEAKHIRRVASVVRSWSAPQLDEICADYFYQTSGQASDIIDVLVRLGRASYSDRAAVSDALGRTLSSGRLLFFLCEAEPIPHRRTFRELVCDFSLSVGMDPDELTGFIGSLEVIDGISAVVFGNEILLQYAPIGSARPCQIIKFIAGKLHSEVVAEPRVARHQLQEGGLDPSCANQLFEALIPYADLSKLSPAADGGISILPLDASKLVDDPVRLITAIRDFSHSISA